MNSMIFSKAVFYGDKPDDGRNILKNICLLNNWNARR